MCDRVALFQRGRIVLMGAVPELARQVLGTGLVVDVEADAATDLDARLGAIAGVTQVARIAANHYRVVTNRDVCADIARAVVAANGALHRLSVDAPSLEAIYARFFQKQAENPEGARDAA
jgi:ABC-2 type transport system ATP-binding protein